MASLHRRPKSPNFHAAYTGPTGQRLFRSTGTSDRGEALRLAIKWEDAARAARAKAFTTAQAHRILSECVEVVTGEKLHSFTCEDWLKEWLEGKKKSTSAKTFEKYESDVTAFIDDLGHRATLPLAAINPKEIREWRDKRHRRGLSAPTCNLALKVLKGAFGRAVDLGYIAVNPCAAVDPLKDDGDSTRDIFTAVQVQQLVGVADGDWKGVILAGYFTGLRLTDITNLTANTLDLDSRLLRLKTKKTGKMVAIPLHTELMKWLNDQPTKSGKAPVFASLHGKSGSGKSGLSSQFKRIMAKAGIVGRTLREAKGDGREQSSLSFHSLRHSFVSALANAGVPAEIRQKLAGHSDSKTHLRYSHHEIETMKKAVALLPSLVPLRPPQPQ